MKYVFGNWKMNLNLRESVALARSTARFLRGQELVPEVVIFPAFTALSEVRKALSRSRVNFGAQNIGPERSGAYTGEVSAPMLEDVGCTYALIGHSERRHVFGETNTMIQKRIEATLASRITPVLCVGETQAERARGDAQSVVKDQLHAALKNQRPGRTQQIFIAYEPVWAIGSGEVPAIAEVLEMHQFIRQQLMMLGWVSDSVYVLYGGSVKPANAYELLRESEIDGVLVGGASIKIRQFEEILQAATDVITAQMI